MEIYYPVGEELNPKNGALARGSQVSYHGNHLGVSFRGQFLKFSRSQEDLWSSSISWASCKTDSLEEGCWGNTDGEGGRSLGFEIINFDFESWASVFWIVNWEAIQRRGEGCSLWSWRTWVCLFWDFRQAVLFSPQFSTCETGMIIIVLFLFFYEDQVIILIYFGR